MHNFSRTRLRITAALVAAFIAQAAAASEHIIVSVAPDDNLGAGFGELSPDFHDLRVTLDASGENLMMVSGWDTSGTTMWEVETQTSSSATLVSYNAQEDNMGAVWIDGEFDDPAMTPPFVVGIANALWPCADCGVDEFGMPLCAVPNNPMGICDTAAEGEVAVYVPGDASVSVAINHTAPGTLTILGATSDIEILNPDETPFASAYVNGESSVSLIVRAGPNFSGEVTLVARFLQENAQLDTQDLLIVKAAVEGEVAKVVQDDGSTSGKEGPIIWPVGVAILLRAIPGPPGEFPDGEPHWVISDKPDGSEVPSVLPAGFELAQFTPDVVGEYVIEASCGESSSSISVTAVGVDRVIEDGSDPEDDGPLEVKLGLSVDLRAMRDPAPEEGPWPEANPKWEITDAPSAFSDGKLLPTTGGVTKFAPDETGTWKVKAKCGITEDEITIEVVNGCSWIAQVSADQNFERVDAGPASESTPMNVVGLKGNENDLLTLTITLANGGDPNKVTWEGATQDATNKLQATVPIDVSELKQVTVLYDATDCREIFVWPVLANVVVRIDGQLSPDNRSPELTFDTSKSPDNFWDSTLGGGRDLGTIDMWTTPALTEQMVAGRIEAVATLTPSGVGNILPAGRLAFKRRKQGYAWLNAGHYNGETWVAGPVPGWDGSDLDDSSDNLLLDVNPQGNDKLFDIDSPGLQYKQVCPTYEMYVNYTQRVYLTLGGQEYLCSNEAPWSFEARIDLEKEEEKVELLKLRTSHLDFDPPPEPHYEKR